MSLHKVAACHLRAFRELHRGQGTPPFVRHQKLLQTFGSHGEGGDLQAVKFLREAGEEFLIDIICQISDCHIGVAHGAYSVNGEGQLVGAYSASNQICIKQHGFHKTIPGTPGHRFCVRFRNSPCRIGPGINNQCIIKSLHKEQGRAAQQISQKCIPVTTGLYLSESDFGCGKVH